MTRIREEKSGGGRLTARAAEPPFRLKEARWARRAGETPASTACYPWSVTRLGAEEPLGVTPNGKCVTMMHQVTRRVTRPPAVSSFPAPVPRRHGHC